MHINETRRHDKAASNDGFFSRAFNSAQRDYLAILYGNVAGPRWPA
jgi:hypothetical protein